jgi:hypothetical protein
VLCGESLVWDPHPELLELREVSTDMMWMSDDIPSLIFLIVGLGIKIISFEI